MTGDSIIVGVTKTKRLPCKVILASTTLMVLLYLKSDPSLSLTVGMQGVSHGKKKSVNSSQLQENSKMTSFLTDETNKIPT